MLPKICSFQECTKQVQARNLCAGHYAQRGRGKDLTPLTGRAATTGMDDDARFWFRVDKSAECWMWTAGKNASGYGMVKYGRQALAHRVAWEMENGPIPSGFELDHKCRNRSCVRPLHMQAVTHKMNTENRNGAQVNSKSGIRGVTPQGSRWQAQIVHHGRPIYIGIFSTITEAEAAVITKRNEIFTNNLKDRKSA